MIAAKYPKRPNTRDLIGSQSEQGQLLNQLFLPIHDVLKWNRLDYQVMRRNRITPDFATFSILLSILLRPPNAFISQFPSPYTSGNRLISLFHFD